MLSSLRIGRPQVDGTPQRDNPHLDTMLRLALLNHGVDCAKAHGWLSVAHTSVEINQCIDAYSAAFEDMINEGLFT
jgi:glutamate-1-semialdehyde aminotransferase